VVAEHLAALGYNLALSYSADDAAAEATRAAVAGKGRECLIVKGGTRRRPNVEALFAGAKKRFGSHHLAETGGFRIWARVLHRASLGRA
jgi:3-oxoacyl-[acyl-carrier protein] reductase